MFFARHLKHILLGKKMQVFFFLKQIYQGFNPLLHKSEMSRIVSRQEETRLHSFQKNKKGRLK